MDAIDNDLFIGVNMADLVINFIDKRSTFSDSGKF